VSSDNASATVSVRKIANGYITTDSPQKPSVVIGTQPAKPAARSTSKPASKKVSARKR